MANQIPHEIAVAFLETAHLPDQGQDLLIVRHWASLIPERPDRPPDLVCRHRVIVTTRRAFAAQALQIANCETCVPATVRACHDKTAHTLRGLLASVTCEALDEGANLLPVLRLERPHVLDVFALFHGLNLGEG